MSDHDKLREAIRIYRERLASKGEHYFNQEYLEQAEVIVAAAESTLPKTKTVEVWRVEWASAGTGHPELAQFTRQESAESWATEKRLMGRRCVRVTGPHQQEVPA